MSDIVFVNDEEGDWQGMYVDGSLLCENHSIDAEHAVNSLKGFEIDSVSIRYVNQDWLEDSGWLPRELHSIPGEVIR